MLHSGAHPGTSRHGSGVVAIAPLARGTVVWGVCGTCTDWSASRLRDAPLPTQEWLDEFGYGLAGGGVRLPCGGAHLLNHACDANVLDAGLSVGIAVREIAVGEEVTIDYRTFRYEKPWAMQCECDRPTCAGTVRSTDAVPSELGQTWAHRVAAALDAGRALRQELPLRPGAIDDPAVGESS